MDKKMILKVNRYLLLKNHEKPEKRPKIRLKGVCICPLRVFYGKQG
jgi:hypothetical protein